MTLFSLIIPVLLFLICYVSVGHFIVRKLGIAASRFEKLLLSVFAGMALGSTIIALLGFLIGTVAFPVYLIVSGIIGVIEVKQAWKNVAFLNKYRRSHWEFIFGSVMATVLMASSVFLSGIPSRNGIGFQEAHDNLWHVALIQNLLESIPPQHPSFSQIPLTNYHYFYDVFLASLSYLTPNAVLPVYFQFSSLLLAGLLVASSIILGRKIGGTKGAFWLTFFTICGGSFAYLIPFFHPSQSWHESSFWVSQTFAMMVNPQMIYSLALTYISLWLLLRNPKKIQDHLLIILLIASSMGFKSYSWVVLSPLYAFSLLVEIVRTKKALPFIAGILYILASLPVVWIVTGFKSQSIFFYEPLWFLNTMVEAPDRLNVIRWKFLEDHYRSLNVWYKVWFLKLVEGVIFYIGNLGIRVVGFALLPLLFFKKWGMSKYRYLAAIAACGFILSSSIPLFFLQQGQVWNTIQFWYYSLIFANVLVVIAIGGVTTKIPKKVVPVVTFILLALALPTTIQSFFGRLNISTKLTAPQYQFLSSLTPEQKISICPSSSALFKSVMIEALSPAKVYLSDPGQLELVGADQTIIKTQSTLFTHGGSELRTFIEQEHITHILCAKDGNHSPLTSTFPDQLKRVDDWFVYSVR